MSSDDCLQAVGNNTGINYSKDFDEYLELLVLGLQKKKRSTLEVFREWDRLIFPNSDSSLVNQEQSDASSGFKAALEMLEADEVEEDQAAAGEGGAGEGAGGEGGEQCPSEEA